MSRPAWAPTLSDGVVTLRGHGPGDIPAVVEMCNDPQMVRWTLVPVPYGTSDGDAFIRSRRTEWEAGRSLTFAVEDRQGRYAGAIDLRPDGTSASVGYGLTRRARGHGLCSRALRLLLTWGFEEVGLEVVHWSAEVGNWPSRRAAWAVGFRFDGTVRGLLAGRPGPDGVAHRLDGWIGSLRTGDPLVPMHTWHQPPVLTDGVAVLRPHNPEDLDRMVEACADPLTQEWLPDIPARYGDANARAHLEEIAVHHASGVALYWALCRPGDDRLAGEIGLFGISPDGPTRSVEVGYWTHPDARGRGITSAGVRLAVRHALLPVDDGGLGAQRVLVRAAVGNVASQRVAEKAGLRACGRDRQVELRRDGTGRDLLRFDLVADDLAADGTMTDDITGVPVHGHRTDRRTAS